MKAAVAVGCRAGVAVATLEPGCQARYCYSLQEQHSRKRPEYLHVHTTWPVQKCNGCTVVPCCAAAAGRGDACTV